ncbi:MAG: RNA polymerase sigma factor [Polyangiaceae bacterium]|nr:RNA polymerase sigma factor [Polyangiaceae bacterium]
MTEPDLSLVARQVQRGDGAAFRTLVERTQGELFRLAARLMGNTADADEVLQDAYVKAHRALSAGQFDGRAMVRTWLYRVVTNTARDALRRRAARPAGDDRELEAAGVDSGRGADARLALAELSRWLDELPIEQRAALVLCSVEGLTNSEAAAALGVSAGAVEQRLVRARATLRKKRGGDE